MEVQGSIFSLERLLGRRHEKNNVYSINSTNISLTDANIGVAISINSNDLILSLICISWAPSKWHFLLDSIIYPTVCVVALWSYFPNCLWHVRSWIHYDIIFLGGLDDILFFLGIYLRFFRYLYRGLSWNIGCITMIYNFVVWSVLKSHNVVIYSGTYFIMEDLEDNNISLIGNDISVGLRST